VRRHGHSLGPAGECLVDVVDVLDVLSQLRYVTSSQAAARSLAENYVGLTTL